MYTEFHSPGYAENQSPAPGAVATYNAAAEHFDAAPLAFWDRHGRRAVDLACLRRGDRVLDVGCGTGASALPAAQAVGPDGEVIGLDVAENMLIRARGKAAARGLDNVTFHCADMSRTDQPDQSFDAVISVFSIFFVPDMERQIAALWRMLRPNGRLVVTVWGQRSFEPAVGILLKEIRRIRPDIPATPRPWERLTLPQGLHRMMTDGGTTEPDIHQAPDRQVLLDPSDWWTISIGSGFRGVIDQLGRDEQQVLRTRVTRRLADAAIRQVETNALHAIARKGA